MIVDADLQAFLAGGVSITVTTRSRDNVPSLARAKGCRVLARDPTKLRIFVSATQAAEVLRDLREIGAISVAFTQPQTHRAFQFKGRDVRIEPIGPEDRVVLDKHVGIFADVVRGFGFSREFVEAFYSSPPDEVAIEFAPLELFQQTPGPKAGARVC